MARSDAKLNKEKIIEVFKELTRRNGGVVPSMSDLVRHSGLGRGTVYRHFPDIGSLAFEILNGAYQELFSTTREKIGEGFDELDYLDLLEDHLRRSAKLAFDNQTLLLADECRVSVAYAKAVRSMREVIGEILVGLSGVSAQKIDIYSDLIARCVEAGHLRDTHETTDLELSIEVAIDIARNIN